MNISTSRSSEHQGRSQDFSMGGQIACEASKLQTRSEAPVCPGSGRSPQQGPPPPKIFPKIQVKRPDFTNKEAEIRGTSRCCDRPTQKLQLSDMLTFHTLST